MYKYGIKKDKDNDRWIAIVGGFEFEAYDFKDAIKLVLPRYIKALWYHFLQR